MKRSGETEDATPASTRADSDKEPKLAKSGRRLLINTGSMAGSSLWRILVSFLLQLLVLRALGLEAHGRYTVALAYLNVSQIMTELGLQNLLVRNLARQNEDRSRYFTMSLGLQICMALIVWGILWGVGALFPYTDAMRNILWLVGATLPLYAITISCQTIFQASERMELVMVIEVAVNTLIGVISVIILYQQGDVGQLITLLIATQALSAVLCLYLLFREKLLLVSNTGSAESASESHKPSNIGWWQLLRESSPFYGLSVADVLLQRLDILLLSIFAGEVITGIYSASYNVIRVLQKLTQSYWKALFPTLSRLAHRAANGGQGAGYQSLQQASLKYGLLILLGAAVVLTPAGKLILNMIYDLETNLDTATVVFQLLIWSAPLYLFELYAITILMAEDRPSLSLLIMGVHLAAVTLLLPSLTAANGAQGAGLAVLLATAVGVALSAVIIKRMPLFAERTDGLWLLVPALVTGIFLYFIPTISLIVMIGSFLLYLALVWLCGIVTLADLSKIKSV